MLLMQGNTYQLPVSVKLDGERVTDENAAVVEFAFDTDSGQILKEYPKTVTFKDGNFVVPLTQEDTFALQGRCKYQVRVLFNDGNVKGSDIMLGTVKDCISRVVLK